MIPSNDATIQWEMDRPSVDEQESVGTISKPRTGVNRHWVSIALAIWAVAASATAIYARVEFTRMKSELTRLKSERAKDLTETLLAFANTLYPNKDRLAVPMQAFDPWLPIAMTNPLPDGGIQYCWQAGGNQEGPGVLIVEGKRNGCVKTIEFLVGDY